MAACALLVLLILSLAAATSHSAGGSISAIISQPGLDFVKDILVDSAVRSLATLRVPDMDRTVHIPIVGNVHIIAGNITLQEIRVNGSTARAGEDGFVIAVGGAEVDLSMDWSYSYSTWLVKISDQGNASIQVKGMDAGITMDLKNKGGFLSVNITECGCSMNAVDITLDGGASWFYQVFVDGFRNHIRASVENAIVSKILEGTSKLDLYLHDLPKEINVDKRVALNVTIVDDPRFTASSVKLVIAGSFFLLKEVNETSYLFGDSVEQTDQFVGASKMLWISLDESVFNSASAAYFQAGAMHWMVNKVPDQDLLNTRSWKYIVPVLFVKYPNDDMILNVSVASSPNVKITIGRIDATIHLEITVNVINSDQMVPVGCISVDLTVSGTVGVSGNNLVGRVDLKDFSLSLKWSDVGDFHTSLIQGVMHIFLRSVFVPYVNTYLLQGFPLPIIKGFTIKDAYVLTSNSRVIVSSNVVFNSSDIVRQRPPLIGRSLM